MTLKSNMPEYDNVARDAEYWRVIGDIAEQQGYSLEQMLRRWPSFVMRRDLVRFLSQYELFKKVENLPGCIVEFGVFKGASFFTWCNLLDVFCPYDRFRKVFGFDSFVGLANFTDKDGQVDASGPKSVGAYCADEEEIRALLDIHNADAMIPNANRAELVVGDIMETLPKFVEENPGLTISLLHFDADLYEPTKLGLELLYPLVTKGGVIVFDEYGAMPWQGETSAVMDYFSNFEDPPRVVKHPWAQSPSGFIVK